VSHPSLGLSPRDLTRGFPDGAARIRQSKSRLAARALEIAADGDPSLLTRHDEIGLRTLLGDAEVYLERLALSVAGDDPFWLAAFCEHTAIVYRRNRVRLDDAMNLLEGIRSAVRSVLSDDEQRAAEAAIDGAQHGFREQWKLAGDARPKNRLLQALYKGG
jgi:hypothetical protein